MHGVVYLCVCVCVCVPRTCASLESEGPVLLHAAREAQVLVLQDQLCADLDRVCTPLDGTADQLLVTCTVPPVSHTHTHTHMHKTFTTQCTTQLPANCVSVANSERKRVRAQSASVCVCVCLRPCVVLTRRAECLTRPGPCLPNSLSMCVCMCVCACLRAHQEGRMVETPRSLPTQLTQPLGI